LRRAKHLARRVLRVARRVFAYERPIVLMYHRVERVEHDPWELAVSPENFATQIRLLTQARRVVPMSWLGAEIVAGRLPRHVAAVTFDDAYVDVMRHALPVLEAHSCPATMFVPTSAIGRSETFWWDLLIRVMMGTPTLPSRLVLTEHGRDHVFEVGAATPAKREEVHFRMHRLLKPLPREEREKAILDLARSVDAEVETPDRDRPMTHEELVRFAASPVIEIGAHTRWHPSMPALAPEEMAAEVAESRRLCREWTGGEVTGFAYPYGDLNDQAVEAVRTAGITHAVTTEGLWVGKGTQPLRIPRLFVGDWDAEAFRREILAHV
jgi:peptidoglycan/xylan/chitin deacetylase (PgdA/CDA1 family)